MNFIHGTSFDAPQTRWPGFDWDFYAHACGLESSTEFQAEIAGLSGRYTLSDIKPIPFAAPVRIGKSSATRLQRFCRAYHRLIATIVSRYPTERRLQETITLPPAIMRDALRDQGRVRNTVSLCRVDFYMHGCGSFSVLETNANCPGSLLYSGIGAAFWRARLSGMPPKALPSENLDWYGEWYVRAATTLTGRRPDRLTMFRQEGGYRYEFDEIAAAFQSQGIRTSEADPREVTRQNAPDYGYLKLSIPEFARMRRQLDPFIDSILAGDLFIQNGLLGRWIGDNKLCLAALSDPTLADLFDPADLDTVRAHIPWSRNIAQCDPATVADIAANPAGYVLKRPLDTRGRGVIIGHDATSQSEWATSITNAIEEGWLVMAYVEPTYIPSGSPGQSMVRHDLALGLVDGAIAGGFVRSSPDYKVNVALNGRLHPIFLDL